MAKPRMIILADDRRHVSVGRDTKPRKAKIAFAATALQAQELGGWPAGIEDSCRGKVVLTPTRKLASVRRSFVKVEVVFQQRRAA